MKINTEMSRRVRAAGKVKLKRIHLDNVRRAERQ